MEKKEISILKIKIIYLLGVGFFAVALVGALYIQHFEKTEFDNKIMLIKDVPIKKIILRSQMRDANRRGDILDCYEKPLSVYKPTYIVNMDFVAEPIKKVTNLLTIETSKLGKESKQKIIDRQKEKQTQLNADFLELSKSLSKYSKKPYSTLQKFFKDNFEMSKHEKSDFKKRIRIKEIPEIDINSRDVLVSEINELYRRRKANKGKKKLGLFERISGKKQEPRVRSNIAASGIYCDEKGRRSYPYGNMAHTTIGHTWGDGGDTEVIGIEKSFNEYLIKSGDRLRADVITTIDPLFQDIAEEELRKVLEENKNFEYGTIVLMEVESGEIRAMANLTKHKFGYFDSYNYAVRESMDPGSTFKIASLVASLETGKIDIDTEIDCDVSKKPKNGKKTWKGIFPNDVTKSSYSVTHIMKRSLNTGTANMVDIAFNGNAEKFIEAINKLHIGDSLGIGLIEEQKPIIKHPGMKATIRHGGWDDASMYKIAVGYESKISPINTLCFYNAIANNGVMVYPKLVVGIRNQNGKIERLEKIEKNICSKKTADKVKRIMSSVVGVGGSANSISGTNYGIAGKTGTAKIWSKDTKYFYKQHFASFCGFFPEEKPQYTCIVGLYTKKMGANDDAYGGTWAAPPFKKVSDRVYAISKLTQSKYEPVETVIDTTIIKTTGVNFADLIKKLSVKVDDNTSKTDWVEVNISNNKGSVDRLKINSTVVPDVIAMGLRDAIFALESLGLKVTYSGKGRVSSQSISPDSPLVKGQTIKLNLGN